MFNRESSVLEEVCPFQPILYGDFMSPGSDVKSYELITNERKVRVLLGP